MQKIISGKYKGHLLSNIPVSGIRPTQARVRKSIFQILEPLSCKSVLDLFSGSGILGIEALSRGAQSLISVENNKKVFSILNQNLNKICKNDNFNAVYMDAIEYLDKCKKKFDIIICDPPYNKHDHMEIFQMSSSLINKNGFFCMEMSKKEVDSNIFRTKSYGSTQIILWRQND